MHLPLLTLLTSLALVLATEIDDPGPSSAKGLDYGGPATSPSQCCFLTAKKADPYVEQATFNTDAEYACNHYLGEGTTYRPWGGKEDEWTGLCTPPWETAGYGRFDFTYPEIYYKCFPHYDAKAGTCGN